MGKYGRILLIGCLLIGQAPPITVVSAETVTEETSINQDSGESRGAEEEEVSSTSSENEGDTTSSSESSSSSNTDSREPSQADSSKSIESTDFSNESSEASQDKETVTEDQQAEVFAENIASGTFGTSEWYITAEGVLHIGEGQLPSSTSSSAYNIPWWEMHQNDIKEISIDGPITAGADSSYLFFGLRNLTTINNLNLLDISNAVNISQMFQGNSSLTSLDLSNFNTSNVVSMRYTFSSMSSLQTLDVSQFDTSNVTTMVGLFAGSSNLQFLDLANFDTSKVTDMYQMFQTTTNLSKLRLGTNFQFKVSWDGNALLPNVASTEVYTGNWQNIGTGTAEQPNGNFVGNSTDLMDQYNGATMADLYVWQPRSDSAGVTINYLDRENNVIAEPTILSGKVGLPYDSEPKEIPGWYVVETPDNASGIFTEDPQEVVYVYERSDAAPVTVRYQDSEGNQLAEPSILSGKVGLPYDSEPKEIPGWYVVETPDNASGTFSEEVQEVVYVYNRSDAAPVTVKYQDSEGNQLAEPSILSGKVGLAYDSEPKEIPGWYVVETPDNASGTFSEEAQEVVYVYDRSDAAPVTVKYQDSEGNQLAEPSILSGKVGLPYDSDPKEIPGWYVVETPDNASGTFSEEAQEVVYVYDRSDAAPVTVKYQDSEGNQLAEPSILSGKVDLPYNSEPKEIPGWYVVETPDNASGTFSEEAQEVVYVYDRSDAAPVTVKYQDSEGNQLAVLSILSGKVGLTYTSEAKEISGWYLVKTPANASGTFSDTAQEVVYVYSTKSHNSNSNGNSNNHLPKTGEQMKGQIVLSSVGALLVTLVFVAFKKRKRSKQ